MSLTYYINDGALSGYSRALGVWREPLHILPDGVLRGCLCPLYAFTRHSLSATLTAALSFPFFSERSFA
jgi:hypothetical protein